jgi:type II secretory pathway pseudopilin PulG
MVLIVVLAVALLIAILYAAERARRAAAARHRRETAEARLRAVMREKDNELARDRKKKEQAGALTSVVPAIRRHGNRHVA